MTTDLRESLDDLLADVPVHVAVPDPAAAWRAGARRRVRRRLVAGAASLAVVAMISVAGLVGSGVVDVQPATDGSGSSATSYPARIDKPLFHTGTLPDHPGPIAGLVQRKEGWFAVGQSGQVWRVPGATDSHQASISPDGSRVAYVDASHGQSELTLLDLNQGGAFTPDIGGSGPSHAWLLDGPTFWSPDSTRLLVPVRPGDGSAAGVDALVVSPAGAMQRVQAPEGRDVEPIGWISPTRLGWLRWTADPQHPSIVITGVRGGRILKGSPAPAWIPRSTWETASIVPDTSGLAHVMTVSTAARLLLISNPGQRANSALVDSRPVRRAQVSGCPVSWGASQPWLSVRRPGDDASLVSLSGASLIQADPGLDVGCSVWATSALDGSRHAGIGGWLSGQHDTWLSWHWRQVAIGTGAVAVLLAGYGLVLRRRRRRTTIGAG